MSIPGTRIFVTSCIAALVATAPAASFAQGADGNDRLAGTRLIASPHAFDVLIGRLEESIEANKMGIVARASASAGAAARGVKIPGNLVLMVFRNDYAVRMLEASVPAGIEAPLRFYVTEGPSGKASITYRAPSAVFAPYRNAKLDTLAGELDPVFDSIVRGAVAP